MTEAEKAYQYFVIAVPESEEQAKAYFWARKALQPTLTPPNEWVSVEERLPEDDVSEHKVQIAVLVLTDRETVKIKNRTYHPEKFYYGKFYPERWDWGTFNDDRITHWMLLPAPPTKEE